MHRDLKLFTVAAALIGVAALPVQGSAQAQTGWGSFQIHTGWMHPSALAESPDLIVNGVTVNRGFEFGLDDGWGIGAGLDFWFGGGRMWGLNLEGTYRGWDGFRADFDPDFDFDDFDFDGDDLDFGQDIALWQYDASLAFRPIKATANTRWLPWLSAGIGGVSVDPDDDIAGFPRAVCVGGVLTRGNNVTCAFEPADVLIDTSSHTEVAFVPGVGFDYFITPSITFRMELKDYWTDDSPFLRLSDDLAHDGGNNWQINGGFAAYWGGRAVQEPGFVREEPVIVRPPEPTPPPPPPPPPAEARMSICVVNTQNYQLTTIDAIRTVDDNKVYVMQNGQRMPIEQVYPANAPIYVRNASWYMSDQPLTIDLETDARIVGKDRNRIELVQFGSPAQLNQGDLVFVGTINGSPIYAKRTDVAPFLAQLQPRISGNPDLAMILKSDADLARSFGGVKTYYVAVTPNCVFHPVSVTHFVRRTRG